MRKNGMVGEWCDGRALWGSGNALWGSGNALLQRRWENEKKAKIYKSLNNSRITVIQELYNSYTRVKYQLNIS